MNRSNPGHTVLRGLVDLASERIGGLALAASDEFFAPKESLLRPEPAIFDPDRYTERGKWMDGWESRRRRDGGHDWCVLRLGVPGRVRAVDIDTSHFLGNHPPYAALEGCLVEGEDPGGEDPGGDRAATDAETKALGEADWHILLPRSPLAAGSANLYVVGEPRRVSHVRLRIYPDGGVARLRVYGTVEPDWRRLAAEPEIDLAALVHGGRAVAASDLFFSPMDNLILPGPARTMGEGWETRRRRGPGHDWVIVRLARSGRVHRLEIDTRHFKGNHPARVSVDACADPGGPVDGLSAAGLAPPDIAWVEILPGQPLGPDALHTFAELRDPGPWSHVRVHIYPDGGLARLRVWGKLIQPNSEPGGGGV